MKDGLGSPIVRFYYQGNEIQDHVESFKYKQSEEDDETCEVNIRHDDRNAPDLPQYQEGASWTVIWGNIGGNFSRVHKIYLQEIKWEFDDQNVLLTASFTERAISLKQRSASTTYTKTSIVDILHNVAKVHGLTAFVEIPGQYTKPQQKAFKGSTNANTNTVDILSLANKVKKQPLQIQLTDSLMSTLKAYADKQVTKDQLDTTLFGSTEGDIRQAFLPSGEDIDLSNLLHQRDDTRNLLTSFNTYGTIPQANRTDKQVLEELAKRQPDGPFFIDSHDDVVILKRRHFDKPANRSYSWADGKGDLIAFQPESRNRSKKGTSVAVTVQAWDKNNKTFLKTSTDAKNESAQNTLAKSQAVPIPLDSGLTSSNDAIFEKSGLTNRVQFSLSHDSTNVVKVLPAEITRLTGIDVVQENLQKMIAPATNNVNITDPTVHGPKAALDNAGNNRRGAELKNNPGYMEVLGDPTLEKGQIITILGVSKKYSGNYYIKSVTHEIDGYKSYLTRCDLVRQGVNIKTPATATAKETGKTVNTTVGEPDGVLSGDMKTYLPRQSTLAQDKTRVIKVLPIIKTKTQ